MSWRWNKALSRYQDDETGQILSFVSVRTRVNALINAATNSVDTLSNLVHEGQLAPSDFNSLMRTEIKRLYIQEYLLGRGGVEVMTSQDWGSIGGMLADQYRYLDNFTNEIAAFELTEGQIRARAAMYLNSAREGFERANMRSALEADADEEIWLLSPLAENCPDCEAFAALGWMPIVLDAYGGAFPGSGDTVCLTNCQCRKAYRNSVTGEEF